MEEEHRRVCLKTKRRSKYSNVGKGIMEKITDRGTSNLYPSLVGLSEAALYGRDMAYSRGGRGEIGNIQNVLSKSLY